MNDVFLYRAHVDTVSEEEAAQVGRIGAEVIRLQCGESLQDMKSCVLQAPSDQAQAQVHGIYKKNKKKVQIESKNQRYKNQDLYNKF